LYEDRAGNCTGGNTSSPRSTSRLAPDRATTRRFPSNGFETLEGLIVRVLPTGSGHTPQLPPKPIVTLPPSTTTGTSRTPLLWPSIRSSDALSFLTLTYSTSTPRLAKSSRAAWV
jgi:hypothetical protein